MVCALRVSFAVVVVVVVVVVVMVVVVVVVVKPAPSGLQCMLLRCAKNEKMNVHCTACRPVYVSTVGVFDLPRLALL